MKIFLRIMFLCSLFLSTGLSGQETEFKKAIVMINGDVFLVDLTPTGTILKKFQQVPNYFQTTASDEQIIKSMTEKGLIASAGIDFSNPGDPVQRDSDEPPLGILRDRQFIEFSLDRAVLNQQAVDQIRRIADAYQEGRIKTVKIHSFHTDTPDSRILAQNRATAITDLMQTFGIPLRNIQINMPYNVSGGNVSFVNISFD